MNKSCCNLAIFLTVTAGWLSTAVWAADRTPAAEPFDVEVVEAEYLGQSPMLEELVAMTRPPYRDLPVSPPREVPNLLVPEFLATVQNVDAPPSQLALSPVYGYAPAADLSFGGYDSADNLALFGGLVAPPDTEGDVGLTHYVQWNNLGFKVFLKDGTEVTPPNGLPGNIFWQGLPGHPCQTSNDGDPIVLYDHLAGRWLFSQFDLGPGLQCTAISAGEDPLAGPYTLYALPVGQAGFNDYPKIGIWTSADGSQSAYHFSTNEFGPSFLGAQMMAWERDAMLAGETAFGLKHLLPYTGAAPVAFSLQPGHLEGYVLPPAGTCQTYIQAFDSETWGVPGDPDGYRTWRFCVDWDRVGAAGGENPFIETPFEFDQNLCNFSPCVPQPNGQLLDTLGQFTMYRFAVRDVRGSFSAVLSHTVDVGTNLAGVAWAKFNMNGPAPVLGEYGKLDLKDGKHRWMPSISQDGEGNIGIGYSVASATTFPSVYFTGRLATDPAGTLQAESVCIDGTGSQSGINRWGDYSTVSIDPADDCTFWVTNEYVETTGVFSWDTQICTYKFPGCGEPLSKRIVSGTDRNGDGQPDRVVEADSTFSSEFLFAIDYYNPGGPAVLIKDVVPSEWNAAYVPGPAPCTVVRADERRNLFSDNHITCEPDEDDSMYFVATARCGDIVGDPTCHPYECGAFFLNEGAKAWSGRNLIEGPSNQLCVAAVVDINGGGIDFSGAGDEDGDGVDDYTEACVNFTDPCTP